MNKFIVWDEENYFGEDNQFYTFEELKKVKQDFDVFDLDLYTEDEPFILTYMDDGEYSNGWKKVKIKLFWDICKTDKECNKIYADCSIVTMTIIDEDGCHLHDGYFTYNNSILCYEFKESFTDGSMAGNRIWRLEKLQPYTVSLKVIGTLQENPELLEVL